MAKSELVWKDNDGDECANELGALCSDFDESAKRAAVDAGGYLAPVLTPEMRAAIDALHEYAHRADPKPLPVYRDYREAQARIAAMKPGDPFRFAYGDGTVAHACAYVGVDVDPVDGETIVAYTLSDGVLRDTYVIHESDLIRTLVREDV